MTDFTFDRARANSAHLAIKRANDRNPVTWAEDIDSGLAGKDQATVNVEVDEGVELNRTKIDTIEHLTRDLSVVAGENAWRDYDAPAKVGLTLIQGIHVTPAGNENYKKSVTINARANPRDPATSYTVVARVDKTLALEMYRVWESEGAHWQGNYWTPTSHSDAKYNYYRVTGWDDDDTETYKVQELSSGHERTKYSGIVDGEMRELDALPDISNFQVDDLIVVSGETYIARAAPGSNQFAGVNAGAHDHLSATTNSHAGAIPIYGQFTSDPDNAIAGVVAHSVVQLQILMKKSSYEAAKGSAIADADKITVVISAGSPSKTDTLTMVRLPGNDYTDDGVDYVVFEYVDNDGDLNYWRIDDGTSWVMRVFKGSNTNTPLLVHDDNLKHWVLFHFEDEVRLDAEISANKGRIETLAEKEEQLQHELDTKLAAFAKHQESIMDTLPDPSSAGVPEFVYIPKLWTPSQGPNDRKRTIAYEAAEYQLTTGKVNKATLRMGRADIPAYNFNGNNRAADKLHGFISRRNRLPQRRPFELQDIGESLHNPVGGAIVAVYSTPVGQFRGNDQVGDEIFLWLKRDVWNTWNTGDNIGTHILRMTDADGGTHDYLMDRANYPGNLEQAIEIGGVTYFERYSSREVPQGQSAPNIDWLKNLDYSDPDKLIVDVEFRTYNNQSILWLGGSAKGWTWLDPDKIPVGDARIQTIADHTINKGDLIASMTQGSNNLRDQSWTLNGTPRGIEGSSTSGGSNYFSHYLDFSLAEFLQASRDGSSGIIIEVERGSKVITSTFLPFSEARGDTNFHLVGIWRTDGSLVNNQHIQGEFRANGGFIRFAIGCNQTDGDSTVKVYRTGRPS